MSNDDIFDALRTSEDTSLLSEVIKIATARRKNVNDEIRAERAELDARKAELKLRHRAPKAAPVVIEEIEEIEEVQIPRRKRKKNRAAA